MIKNLLAFLVGLLLAVSVVPAYAVIDCSPLQDMSVSDSGNPSASDLVYFTDNVYEISSYPTISNFSVCAIGPCTNSCGEYPKIVVGASSGLLYLGSSFSSTQSCAATDGVPQASVSVNVMKVKLTVYAPVDTCMTEPSTCSDLVQSPNESGIDCGDSACVGDEVCSTYCPVGFHLENRQGIETCYSDDDNTDYTVAAKLGVCPAGLYVSSTDSSLCVEFAIQTMASADYLDSPVAPAPTADPWNVFTQDNTVNVSSTSETVDGVTTEIVTTTENSTTTAGDSSENITTVTTVTNADGSKSVTTDTVTNTTSGGGSAVVGKTYSSVSSYDSAGNLTGSSSTASDIESAEGVSSPFVAPGSPDGSSDVVDSELLDSFLDRWVSFSDVIATAPVFSPLTTIFDGPDTSTKTPVFTLSMGSYGNRAFSLSDYDATWDALGLLFIFFAVWSAARTVMGKAMSSHHV